MKVLKFGGSSLATGERIKNVAKIIIETKSKKQGLVIVVSAFGGITDKLIELGNIASLGDGQYLDIIDGIVKRNQEISNVLFPKKVDQNAFIKELSVFQEELKGLVKGIFLLREISPRSLDYLLSFGERISAFTLSYYINLNGKPSVYADARQFIKTDKKYNKATVDFLSTNHLIKDYFKTVTAIPIVTGFISTAFDGTTTVLGRGGSDYTAAIIGAALNASVIEIWTDVNGVLSADPRKVNDAYTIPYLSYDEASEISHFGAKVIYPPTIIPARNLNIPIIIKNSFFPDNAGTTIQRQKTVSEKILKGVTSISKVSMLTLQGSGLVGVPGSAAKLFMALSEQQINIILISQGSSENSISYVISADQSEVATIAQEKAFEKEIENGLVDKAKVESDLSIVSIVGENMRNTPGIAGKMFKALGSNGINVFAIAQGSSELNISAVVHKDNEVKSLKVLHELFFLSNTIQVNLFLAGTGLIGSTLVSQINQQHRFLKEKNNVEIKLIGLTNSRKMLFDINGIKLNSWKEQIEKSEEIADAESFAQKCIDSNLPYSVFVDCTATQLIPAHYAKLLDHSISISTPNKVAISGNYEDYILLKEKAHKNNVFFHHETTVGAGLPVLSTLKNLKESGDKILSIEGVFSGSVSYIFNTFSGKVSFSDTVKNAAKKGYTEPDPRIDLNGVDVKRKLVILSREAGFNLKEEDFKLKMFLPKEVQKAKDIPEFWEAISASDSYFDKLIQKAKKEKGKLRFIGRVTEKGATLSLQTVTKENPFYHLDGSDNMIVFTTERYKERPLVIQGPGAGAEVTASGVFAEILSIISMLKD